MASEQVSRRRENTTSEREIHVETDKVPKMTIHFESLADKLRASDSTGRKETPHGESQPRDKSLEREGRETARQTETTAGQDRQGMKKEKEKESSDDKQLESLAEKVKAIDVGGQKWGYEGGEREGRGTRGESLAEKVEKIEIGGAPMKGVSRGEEREKGRERAGQEERERSEGGRRHQEEGGRRSESETYQVEEKGGQTRGESATGNLQLFSFFYIGFYRGRFDKNANFWNNAAMLYSSSESLHDKLVVTRSSHASITTM